MSETTNFNICIYNTQMRPFLDNVCFKADRIGPRLNDYDIVCLQECFSGDQKLVNKSTHLHKVNPNEKRNIFTIVDSGLVTLGNFDLKYTHFEIYDEFATFQDFIASKGLLMTRWNINGCYVDIYETHMQAGNGEDGLEAARGQVLQLINTVNRHTPEENGLIILGDFNMGPLRHGKTNNQLVPHSFYDDEITYIHRATSFEIMHTQLKLNDVWDILHPNTFDGLDRCLFRNGTKTKLTPNTIKWNDTFVDGNGNQLSDSRPLIVNMMVEKI